MTEQKSTKRALLSSVLATLLCVAMLVGATFAWFTDTASTAVNKIQSGSLKLSLKMRNNESDEWVNADGETLSFLRTDGTKLSADANILWEPGATYKLPQLKISNEGSLALKYKIVISGATGDTDLLSQIDFTSKVNGGQAATFTDGATLVTDKQLLPKEGTTVHSDTIDIEGTMKTTADNKYQNKTITGIAITVVATQSTYEKDSISDQYDKDAEYPIVASAPVKTENEKTTGDTVIYSNEKVTVASGEQSVAKAVIPAGTKLNGNKDRVTMTVKSATAPANFSVGNDENAKTYEIKIPEVAADNTELITVELYVGTGLISPKMYHNGVLMADSDYSYNADTGMMTIKTATFSPFTVAYKKPAATADGVQYETLEAAMANANGKKIVLCKDVKTPGNFKHAYNVDLDLNGYSWTLGDNGCINGAAEVRVSNGKILSKTFASYIDIRPGAGNSCTVAFTNVDFVNTYKLGSKAGGPSTTYTDYALKYNASAGDDLKLTFTGCSFKNAQLYLGGYSNGGTEEVLFDRCKFDALTNASIISSGYKNTGSVTVKDCSFNIITTSNLTAIDLSGEKNVTLNFEGANTFGGRVATDADKPEGAAELKLFSSQSITAYRAKQLTGKDTVTVSGLVK